MIDTFVNKNMTLTCSYVIIFVYICVCLQRFSVYEIYVFHIHFSVVKAKIEEIETHKNYVDLKIKEKQDFKKEVHVRQQTIDNTYLIRQDLYFLDSCNGRGLNLPTHEFPCDSDCFEQVPNIFYFSKDPRCQESTLRYSLLEVIPDLLYSFNLNSILTPKKKRPPHIYVNFFKLIAVFSINYFASRNVII